MKAIKILIVIVFIFSNTKGQDLIVTSSGDSLNCKITSQKGEYIYFAYLNNGAIRRTLLKTTEVSELKYNCFSQIEIPAELAVEPKRYKNFRLAIDGGMAYRYAPLPDGVDGVLEDHLKKLKWGTSLEGELTFFFKESLGLGLKYSNFSAGNKLSNIFITDDSGLVVGEGDLSDDNRIWFFGPAFAARFYNMNYTGYWYLSGALGYMHYSNIEKFDGTRYEYTGETLGIAISGGYDWNLSKTVGMGVKLSIIGGSLYEYEVTDGTEVETIELEDDEYENLARIQLSIGIRLNL